MLELSRDEAREVAVAAQGLAQPPAAPPTWEDAVATVRRLGCIQIDTIHVVARSQYLVLWSRLGVYDPAWLDAMLHPHRLVFEYWAHAASLVSIELFPYFRRRMGDYRERYLDGHPWPRENAHVIEHVRNAIAERGPLGAMHFERPDSEERAGPWSWYGNKPTNRALELLWLAGELAVVRRVNFLRLHDLAERVFPDLLAEELPDPMEERRVLAHRAVLAMGVALPRWVNDYFRTRWGVRGYGGPGPAEILAGLAADGKLVPVRVEGLGDGYVAVANLPLVEAVRAGQRSCHITFLSPFDNLIWDRQRTLALFDFDYRIECYTPASKRRYGYFTLPILYRGRLIGRIDPKAERKDGVLILRSVHLEPGAPPVAELAETLRPALRSFATFHGARSIRVETAPPELIEAWTESWA
ncbi:MAG: crosslink repair DNA glycosylase YcaQ family protein [Sphaerobacter sp.]|nr:crosslink repair DNA glycosylase YcaQ family protein [Sphaerobacter sp.]